jgi:phenylalanyl-tRNA synthetase alpha chain
MEEEVLNLKNLALGQIMDATSLEELNSIETSYFGKNGHINKTLKQITKIPKEDRKQAGIVINEAKKTIIRALIEQRENLITRKSTYVDMTLPGIHPPLGHLHAVTQAIDEIARVFENIGFVRVRYPEVEWDWYAFESLNMPSAHPARDEWETYFVDIPQDPKLGKVVLTPHTSSGQVREMQRVGGKPPIRMINIAKCYRRQSDISHTPMFHQFEGLVVDQKISVVHLKGTLDYFAMNFFGPDRKTRLRPYHFQFTEPSFEVDISCDLCNGAGCRMCKAGWLELGGAGMVHPNVLKAGGVDSTKYSGFAFGWGVERTFMMKSGLSVPDIRMLYSPDLRFLTQF